MIKTTTAIRITGIISRIVVWGSYICLSLKLIKNKHMDIINAAARTAKPFGVFIFRAAGSLTTGPLLLNMSNKSASVIGTKISSISSVLIWQWYA